MVGGGRKGGGCREGWNGRRGEGGGKKSGMVGEERRGEKKGEMVGGRRKGGGGGKDGMVGGGRRRGRGGGRTVGWWEGRRRGGGRNGCNGKEWGDIKTEDKILFPCRRALTNGKLDKVQVRPPLRQHVLKLLLLDHSDGVVAV